MKIRESRRKVQTEESTGTPIVMIDACLARFFRELPDSDLKLADYARLADLESLAHEDDEEGLVAGWVEIQETTEENDE